MGKEREDDGEAAPIITLSPLRFARFRPQPQIFKEDESVSHKTSLPLTMASFTSAPLAIATLLIVTVHLVPAAPILSEQQDIADFSNSAKGPLSNVFLPFRDLPERLIDDFNSRELDDERDLTSEHVNFSRTTTTSL